MSNTNPENEGSALPAELKAESNLSKSEVERRENKIRAAVEYHEREVEAARVGVENLEAKIERLKEEVAAHEDLLEDAKNTLADCEETHSRAIASAQELGDN